MRPIDADSFERDLKEKLLPLLAEKYGKEEAMKGLHFSLQDFINNIHGQPTITQPEQRWIPVSERLPEDERRVLILNDDSRYLIGFVKETDWGKEWRYQFDMYDDDVYEEKEQGKIIAWMPLPEPYQEGEQDD